MQHDRTHTYCGYAGQSSGADKVAITIIRRVADSGDYHGGLTNALQVAHAPSHQAEDHMTIMPHIPCTGILVHTPVIHGHIITVVATPKSKLEKKDLLEMASEHLRIMPVRLEDGFHGNASMFRWARDIGNPRGDMYEVALWDESIVNSGDDIMFAINIPQEAVVIPTKKVWQALADTEAYTVLGGGDSVTATNKFGLAGKMGYVCTGGGALVRFLSGEEPPIVKALKHAANNFGNER